MLCDYYNVEYAAGHMIIFDNTHTVVSKSVSEAHNTGEIWQLFDWYHHRHNHIYMTLSRQGEIKNVWLQHSGALWKYVFSTVAKIFIFSEVFYLYQALKLHPSWEWDTCNTIFDGDTLYIIIHPACSYFRGFDKIIWDRVCYKY